MWWEIAAKKEEAAKKVAAAKKVEAPKKESENIKELKKDLKEDEAAVKKAETAEKSEKAVPEKKTEEKSNLVEKKNGIKIGNDVISVEPKEETAIQLTSDPTCNSAYSHAPKNCAVANTAAPGDIAENLRNPLNSVDVRHPYQDLGYWS